MNARVSREFTFNAAVHYDDTFIINSYNLNMYMDVATEDIREQNIALERIKYLTEYCLENCIFVDYKNTKAIEAYAKANIKVCVLPEEPYDQVVAAVLLSKFNAITEKKMFINEIEICSSICDDVKFFVSAEEDIEFDSKLGVWWTDNSPLIFDSPKKTKKDKIVELKKDSGDWNTIGLGWKDYTASDRGEIVFIPLEK
jgi:hypothetical protein